MAIDFNAIPDEKPSTGSDIAKGQYIAKVIDATMTPAQQPDKPPYLQNILEITDPESNMVLGRVYDKITESTNKFALYKLGRLLKAADLHFQGKIELKDLAKVIAGKTFKVDIVVEEKEGFAKRSVVDIFSGDIFYPLVEGNTAQPVLEPETQASPSPEVEMKY